MLKLFKPKFWDSKNLYLPLLMYPFSLIFKFLTLMKKIFSRLYISSIPIICVGNIYIGGTGKTPTSILLANDLRKKGKKPVIVKKFYHDHKDEHRLIKKYYNFLILNKNRLEAIKGAEKENFDCVILDDGFQDHNIHKNLNILCFNQRQLIGNGFTFPAGPLRENINSLKKAQIIIINGNKDSDFEKKILSINSKVEIFYSKYKINNVDKFKKKKILALAGIGNPENFFQTLRDNFLDVKKHITFPDHYDFKRKDILKIIEIAKEDNYQILMTEKDYMRIEDFKFNEIDYVKVDLEIINKEKLLSKIMEIYDKNN